MVAWYRSFYWRIGVSFVLLVAVVLLLQSAFFGYWLARSNAANPEFSPNNRAARIAADLGTLLAQQPDQNLELDLQSYFAAQQPPVGGPGRPGGLGGPAGSTRPAGPGGPGGPRGPGGPGAPAAFVVMKDGRTASSNGEPLSEEIRKSALAVMAGVHPGQLGGEPRLAGAFVSAPILVGNELRGLVILPPPPSSGEIARSIGRLLSLPNTLLLIVATAVAAILIFRPARTRLRALEQAAQRLGAGDLAARAPEGGGDEIARVAQAFNTMATELAARDEALQTSDRLRRQMFADVSHELKTPLTAMRGYLETLQMPDLQVDAPTRTRYFETVERETRRLEAIVTDLLDLARYQNGVAALQPRVFAIGRIFEHLERRHERELQTRGVTLRTHVDADADQVTGDPDRLEQALQNLVSNALRHTPAGGTIDVQAHMDQAQLLLSVTDSGSGIGAEHLEHVFDRFYKVDPARVAGTNGASGSGLGLSIVKAIVERHGGTIGVTSVPGRTEFRISLPQSSTNL